MRWMHLLVVSFLALSGAAAQTDSVETFRSGVTVIQVPVVVRDRDGHVVNDLQEGDFQLFDDGKRQEIAKFSVEKPGSQVAPDRSLPGAGGPVASPAAGAGMEIPERFVAYVFDDRTIRDAGSLTRIRDASAGQFAELKPGDRAAIFTTSCRVELDFTNDRQKLRDAVSRLRLHPAPACIVSRSQSLQVGLLKAVVKRMSSLPARRDIILVSPGFFVGTDRASGQADLMDAAIRAKVSINAVDAGEVTAYTGNTAESAGEDTYSRATGPDNQTNPLVLVELAHGTGGTYVTGNDFALSFRKLATPGSHYVLGFVSSAKMDGRFHKLTVKLEKSRKLSIDARSGYYAPQHSE